MAQVQNMIIEQGTTFSTELTVKDANGDPMDLTLYSARCVLRKNHASSIKYDILATVLSPTTNGTVRLSLTPAASRAIKAGRYLYNVEVYSAADADVMRIVEGLITINPTTYVPTS